MSRTRQDLEMETPMLLRRMFALGSLERGTGQGEVFLWKAALE